MKKGLILAVCITQSLLLLSQIEKRTLEMQQAASEYRQIADTILLNVRFCGKKAGLRASQPIKS